MQEFFYQFQDRRECLHDRSFRKSFSVLKICQIFMSKFVKYSHQIFTVLWQVMLILINHSQFFYYHLYFSIIIGTSKIYFTSLFVCRIKLSMSILKICQIFMSKFVKYSCQIFTSNIHCFMASNVNIDKP